VKLDTPNAEQSVCVCVYHHLNCS